MKLIPFMITGLMNIGVGVVLFFLLLLGMNGYSEQQATPGLITFIIWVLLVSLLTAILSVVTTNFFTTKKSMNFWVAALISIFVFVIIGVVFDIIGLFISIFVTEALR